MPENTKKNVAVVRIVITGVATLLLVAHMLWEELPIDYVTAVLAVVAALPWLPSILESAKFPGGWEVTFRKIEDKVQDQQAQLETQKRLLDRQQEIINKMVVFSMAFFLFERLKGLYHARKNGTEYKFYKTDDFVKDLRYLRDHGYIEILGINQLEDGKNIAPVVKLTPIGEYCVEMREKYERESRLGGG